MAQENDTDLSTKFSTLNVNAMEFVPSFCVPSSTTTTTATETETETETATATAVVAPTEETAAPTEVPAANTPENPGLYQF